jgi:hypothetical protein
MRKRGRASVSVIVSCFNYERYVGEAIRSALGQAGAATEVIAVDDGSCDGSGVRYLALAWRAFWWLDEYPRLAGALRAHQRLLARSDDVLLYGPRDS